MPSIRRRPGVRGRGRPRIVVVGDLVVDVVLHPERPLEAGTDVPGRIAFVQGGSAATTARWLARLGAATTLVTAVGRDPAGRALVDAVRSDGVQVRASRIAGAHTGRIGVVVGDRERSFVTDRRAADRLRPEDLRATWFARADLVHLPTYSLLGEPLGAAGRRSIQLARVAGAAVSLDLASAGPLLEGGRRRATALVAETAPDLLFATASEAAALLGRTDPEGLLELAPNVVVKRGSKGATVLARTGRDRLRFEVATRPLAAADTTGAGDAFDAGFLVAWLGARAAGRSVAASLRASAVAGNRAAARHLGGTRPELAFG